MARRSPNIQKNVSGRSLNRRPTIIQSLLRLCMGHSCSNNHSLPDFVDWVVQNRCITILKKNKIWASCLLLSAHSIHGIMFRPDVLPAGATDDRFSYYWGRRNEVTPEKQKAGNYYENNCVYLHVSLRGHTTSNYGACPFWRCQRATVCKVMLDIYTDHNRAPKRVLGPHPLQTFRQTLQKWQVPRKLGTYAARRCSLEPGLYSKVFVYCSWEVYLWTWLGGKYRRLQCLSLRSMRLLQSGYTILQRGEHKICENF